MPLQSAWDRAEIDLCGAFQNRWFSQSQSDLSKFLVKEMVRESRPGGRPRNRSKSGPLEIRGKSEVEPKFFAVIEFRDVTSEGLLRASSFKGLSIGTGRS
jgi:hypothetical protein